MVDCEVMVVSEFGESSQEWDLDYDWCMGFWLVNGTNIFD